ncbi:cation:proton antiporter [Streptomyces sp. NPDC003247]|uniref:cation:proton antiporter n=1 Tax=Streptomyces sp. NPDC003247 TaxID=3364677 RepID=UPI003698A172
MNAEQITSSVLVATGAVVALAAVLSALARRIGQPPVIGQVLAGIVLGPSVLGQLPGDPSSMLVPDEVLPHLGVLGQVALVLFMFSVGCELDTSLLRHQGRTVTTVSVAALVVPMAAGVALGWLAVGTGIAPAGASDGWVFPLYLAVALSITAMPVLASIIRDRGLSGTVPGTVATASAALTDVVGWLVLAGVVALAGPHGRSPAVLLGLLACYLPAMAALARPVLRRTSAIPGVLRDGPLVAAALLSGWATHALGLHAVFGAFLAGLLMPRAGDGSPDRELVSWADRMGGLLLPVFFITTGFSVDIGGLGPEDALLLPALLAVATGAKLGGCALAARLGGRTWRESAVVGALMNTRGLTELIALDVGKRAGLLDDRWYALLVVMAVVTTAMTGPLLTWWHRDGGDGPGQRAAHPAPAAGPGVPGHGPCEPGGGAAPGRAAADRAELWSARRSKS